METKDCILTRRSVRKFTDRKVEHRLVEQIISLAAYAPSWKNTQISRYIALSLIHISLEGPACPAQRSPCVLFLKHSVRQ